MCPFIALLVLFQFVCLICDVASVRIDIKLPTNGTNELKLNEGDKQNISFVLYDLDIKSRSNLTFNVRDPNVAGVDPNFIELYQIGKMKTFEDVLTVEGRSIGFTKLDVVYEGDGQDRNVLRTVDIVTIFKQNQVLSKIFTISVAVLVSLNLINMGCALDVQVVKGTLQRPTALLIGFFTHYFFMPLFAFIIGKLLFEHVPYLRLSLFIFGCSPGGTAANMWTVLLGGNLNLSITLTFLSTLLAAIMMPLWLFTLGLQIFQTNSIKIPYSNILTSLFTLVFCVGIGLLIQRYRPKLARKSKKILAPVCGFLIVFIVVFASATYWYLFRLMSWQIILAATLNVWLGFAVGAIFAAIFGQKFEDLISITVETGIQNTGIVFIILRMALESPYQDYAMTIPIASSCTTAIPLTILFLVMKCRTRYRKKSDSNQEICNSEKIPIRSSSKAVAVDF